MEKSGKGNGVVVDVQWFVPKGFLEEERGRPSPLSILGGMLTVFQNKMVFRYISNLHFVTGLK